MIFDTTRCASSPIINIYIHRRDTHSLFTTFNRTNYNVQVDPTGSEGTLHEHRDNHIAASARFNIQKIAIMAMKVRRG